MLLVVAGVIAVSVARSWAQPLPPCKTPQVIQEINQLKTQVATQKEIVDRAEKAWDDAGKAWDEACAKKGPSGNCSREQDVVNASRSDYEKAEAKYHDLSVRLEALERLPNCPEVPQTPPPPPRPEPQPQAQPQPGGLHPPGPGVTATHRETACPRCQPIAAKLNQAADNYALAVNRHDPDQTVFRQQMSEYSGELDQCEKQCRYPITLNPKPTPGNLKMIGPSIGPQSPSYTLPNGPGPQQPQRSPDSGQPLFDWGPYTVPNRPGSVLPQHPTENGPAPR